MASVALRSVSKSFGHVPVITDVNLEIADGELVVFVGPSGCGKSTLLRLIAGLVPVGAGDVVIDGEVVTDIPASKRGIAFVFQSYALYPHMTIARNIGFALETLGLSRREIDAKVAEVAATLKIDHLLARRPRELSGGQRQRVAIGRALVRQPEVFLFDEPLSNLDAALRGTMRLEISELHNQLKTTMIYVTHDQVEAMTMADRIVVMRDGRVEQIGTPLELYDRPANIHVAGFIGSPAMNFVYGRIEAVNGGLHVRVGVDCVLPLPSGGRGETGRAVVCGFRPEHVALKEDGPIAGCVMTVEMNGAFTTLVVEAQQRQLMVQTTERPRWSRGDKVHLSPQTETLHLFDAENGERVDH